MSYQVTIESSGHRFEVAEGETVLDAALRQGVMLPYSCRGGSCGSCAGKVLSGTVHYPKGQPAALTDAAQAHGQALFCQAHADSDLSIQIRELESAADIAPRKLPVRVVKVEQLSHDVRRLYLKPPAKQRLQFLAGQYIEVLLQGGRRRGFSLASAPHDDELLELHIRLIEGGEFTRYVFNELQEKALLRLEGPLGQFYLREDSARPILMMAGGTGFAPIKGILEHAFHMGIKRPIHLYWGVRARRDLYLDSLPQAWVRQYENFRYTPVLSDPLEDDHWDGETGFVHEILLRDHPELSMFDVYTSGPPAMVAAAKQEFIKHGLNEQHLYFDAFEFAADVQPSTK